MCQLGPPEPAGHRDAVFGLCERRGRLLLVRNPRLVGTARRARWDLPGGSVRPGEGLAEALEREWHEETGLEARVGALRLVTDGVKRRGAGRPPLYTWRAFVFEVQSTGEVRPGRGIEDVAWVAREEAVLCLEAPYHGPLRHWLAGGAGEGVARVEWIDPLPPGEEAAGLADTGLRRLVVLAAAAAAGWPGLVQAAAAQARAAGVEPASIREALLQVVPYAGFPRAIAAFAAAGLEGGPPADPPAPPDLDRGRAVFRQVYGETAARVEEGLEALDPALRAWTLAFAYGSVLSRPRLTGLERELLAVGILTALGRLDDPLLGHMRAAIRLGATRGDVEAAVQAVPHALGEANRDAAMALLGRLDDRPRFPIS